VSNPAGHPQKEEGEKGDRGRKGISQTRSSAPRKKKGRVGIPPKQNCRFERKKNAGVDTRTEGRTGGNGSKGRDVRSASSEGIGSVTVSKYSRMVVAARKVCKDGSAFERPKPPHKRESELRTRRRGFKRSLHQRRRRRRKKKQRGIKAPM